MAPSSTTDGAAPLHHDGVVCLLFEHDVEGEDDVRVVILEGLNLAVGKIRIQPGALQKKEKFIASFNRR